MDLIRAGRTRTLSSSMLCSRASSERRSVLKPMTAISEKHLAMSSVPSASPPNPTETEAMQTRVRNCQETVNKRFKDWGILRQLFRHADNLHRHGDIFTAIVVLTQLAINNGEKLFPTGYRDPPYTNTAYDATDSKEEEEEEEEEDGPFLGEGAGVAGVP